MTAREMLEAKRDQLLDAARRNGAVNVRVFGSVVRGTDTPESDFDFLVDRGPERPPFFPGGLQAAYEEILQRKVDIVTEPALHPKIRDRVLQEARPL